MEFNSDWKIYSRNSRYGNCTDATIADAKQSEFPIETLCADNSIAILRYKL